MWIYLASLVTSFLVVGLKGWQHKNVIANNLRSTFVTSYLMAAAEVLTVSLIVKGGWLIALTAGTGAAFGMVCSMMLHDYIYKNRKP
jgi:hypothetical protein